MAFRVLIAGGGVAGLEAALALRDLAQALHALDAAAALSGGVLPAPYAERREEWRQASVSSTSPCSSA